MREVVFVSVLRKPTWLPYIQSLVPAGFPSPALDHEAAALDLNALRF